MKSNEKFSMAGTEGTFAYIVLLATSLGRIGYRDLGAGIFRVRVEPAGEQSAEILSSTFPAPSWKQPGSQYRYSTMVYSGQAGLEGILKTALTALLEGSSIQVNPQAPAFARDLIASLSPQTAGTDRSALLAEAKLLGIAGANSRWGTATLLAKIAEAKPAESEEEERQRLLAAVRKQALPGSNAASRWSLATLRSKLA